VAVASGSNSLSGFAEANGLSYAKTAHLPAQGSTLTRAGSRCEGAATGGLPGGVEGTLAHFTYTYTVADADDHTHTEHPAAPEPATQ
jgi:hypothetical protein